MTTTPTTTPSTSNVVPDIMSVVAAITALLVAIHPGFTVPTIVEAITVPAASVAAGVIQIINIVTHRAVIKAAITAGK